MFGDGCGKRAMRDRFFGAMATAAALWAACAFIGCGGSAEPGNACNDEGSVEDASDGGLADAGDACTHDGGVQDASADGGDGSAVWTECSTLLSPDNDGDPCEGDISPCVGDCLCGGSEIYECIEGRIRVEGGCTTECIDGG